MHLLCLHEVFQKFLCLFVLLRFGSDEKLGNILNPSKPLLARHWTMQWPVFGADCCKTFKRYMYDMSLRVV